MPRAIRTDWTIRRILTNTYASPQFNNRYEYRDRDVIKQIRIKEVRILKGASGNAPQIKYVVQSSSYPQYRPYYSPTDSRGRPRSYQRSYKHQYDVTIELSRLSIDVPFKARVGADRKWRFNSRTTRDTNGKLIESENIKLGINGDWWFRCQWVWAQAGILYGHDWTNGPPVNVNSNLVVFAPKHFISVCEQLINRGFLKKG